MFISTILPECRCFVKCIYLLVSFDFIKYIVATSIKTEATTTPAIKPISPSVNPSSCDETIVVNCVLQPIKTVIFIDSTSRNE